MIIDTNKTTINSKGFAVLIVPPETDASKVCEYFKNDSSFTVTCGNIEDAKAIIYGLWDVKHRGRHRIHFIPASVAEAKDILTDEGVYLVGNADTVRRYENYEYVKVIYNTYPDLIGLCMAMFGWTKFPVLSDKKLKAVNAKIKELYRDVVAKAIVDGNYEIGFDCNGNLIISLANVAGKDYTAEQYAELAEKLDISCRELEYIAYAGLDFVTLNKHDARACANALDRVVADKGSDDVSALGMDESLAYERLHDRLTWLLYYANISMNGVQAKEHKESWKVAGHTRTTKDGESIQVMPHTVHSKVEE